jgi:C4-dicarboxylate-specific signal transduction histidine kinase
MESPAEWLAALFTNYFTAKGKGLGPGLAVTKKS